MTEYDLDDIQDRVERFTTVFCNDAIDIALAACDESLFNEGESRERYRLMLKSWALEGVAKRFGEKADELYDEAMTK